MNAATPHPAVEPIRKSVSVPLDPAAAFELFTAGLHRWWPMASHSVGREKVRALVLEPAVGGELYEEHEDGTRCPWGRVLEWEPPHRFVTTWHPGHEPESAQEVEVRFAATAGGCRVDLEHRGWEALGDGAPDARDHYDNGWVPVMAAFVAGAGGSRSETES